MMMVFISRPPPEGRPASGGQARLPEGRQSNTGKAIYESAKIAKVFFPSFAY